MVLWEIRLIFQINKEVRENETTSTSVNARS
jgi:hypothetical protein